MFSSTTLIALSSLFAGLASALPVRRGAERSVSNLSKRDVSYFMYSGDGSMADFWPSLDNWATLDDLFTANAETLSSSCTQFNAPNNSADEIAAIKTAIQSVSKTSGVDERYIFSVMMQESKGCVRAPTTNYGVSNPGLFQSHNGEGSCNRGSIVTPCPDSMILTMVSDGVMGTTDGPGLKALIAQAGGSDASMYYKAARMYNSGSIAASGDLGAGIATHCYSSDVANRVVGWSTSASTCCLDTGCAIAAPAANPALKSGGGGTTTSPTPTSTSTATSSGGATSTATSSATSTATSSATSTATSSATSTATSTGTATTPTSTSTSTPTGTSKCSTSIVAVTGDDCNSVSDAHSLAVTSFMALNPSINASCTNLMAGTSYCVAA